MVSKRGRHEGSRRHESCMIVSVRDARCQEVKVCLIHIVCVYLGRVANQGKEEKQW